MSERQQKQVRVAALLMDIEAELRQLQLWSEEAPSEEALASTQPFCIDTMTFPEWLQFVFLPTLYGMMEAEEALPDRCGIAPMAEEFFRGSSVSGDGLIATLESVDEALTGEKVDYSTPTRQ